MNIGNAFQPVQIPPEGMERSPWADSTNPSFIDGKKVKGIEFPEVDVSVGWAIDCEFFAYNYRRVDWTSGTLTTTDGESYYINSGNTGNMSSVTYIYFDEEYPNNLQTTTSASNSVGKGKLLVAVASNVSSPKLAEFQVFGGKGGNQLITADNIASGTITANEIASNTIKAGNMDVSQLSAISADMGTIIAGTITGATVQTSSSSYYGVKMNTNGITIFGEAMYFRDNNNNLRGYIGSNSNEMYLIGGGTHNVKVGAYYNIILDAGNGFAVRPVNAVVDLGTSSYPWANIHTRRINLINRSDTALASGDIINYSSGGTDQFRGRPGSGSWTGSFDMSAV